MVKIFKGLLAAYYSCIIVGTFTIMLFSEPAETSMKNNNNFIIMLFFVLVWVIIVSAFFMWMAVKKTLKIHSVLLEECNPKKYIAINEGLLKRNNKGVEQTYLLLNLSSGYIMLGDAGKAKQMLDSIKKFPTSRAVFNFKACYYNNLAAYYLRIKDVKNAQEAIDKMRIVLDEPKFPKRARITCFNSYSDKRHHLKIASGNFEGAEQAFMLIYEREKSKLGKVYAKYMLGRIYIKNNKIHEAKEAFNYVINNGGTTYYVEKSTVLLVKINI